jgi:hypothetical protein
MSVFRTAFYKLLPRWATSGEHEKVLYSLGAVKDIFVQAFYDGLTARFPTYAGASALALIGEDRGIPRGRTETAPHYAERLKRWRNPRGHRVRGNAFALLEQVSEYFGGIQVESIDVAGNHFVRDADGTESATHGESWDWDGDTASWSRFWLILRPLPEALEFRGWGTWDEAAAEFATWDDWAATGATWDSSGATPEDVAAIRGLLRPPVAWKPAGTRGEYAIVVLQDRAIPITIDPAGQDWDTAAGRAAASSVLRFWRLS